MEAFLPTLVRSNHAPMCLGPEDVHFLLDLHLDQAPSHVPHRSQGNGWMPFLYYLLQAGKYNSTGLTPITCPPCLQLSLPLCWQLAIPPFLWRCGASSQPFTDPQVRWAMPAVCKALLHLCLSSEWACNSWEPPWRNQSPDCTWQPYAVLLRWGCYLAWKIEFILSKLIVMGRMETLAWAADGFFRKTFWERVQVSPFMWCMCILAADLD